MKSNTPVSPQEGRQVVNVMEHVSEKALIEIVGDLSLEDKEFCEKETKQILELLSPKQFAALLLERSGTTCNEPEAQEQVCQCLS